MKPSLILVGAILLLLACFGYAGEGFSNAPSDDIDAKTMIWPMLPGESLQELAVKFYPKNKTMQRRFVFKTMRLNAEQLPRLNPTYHFNAPTAIVIPTLKSLATQTHRIKKTVSENDTSHSLHWSYNLQATVEKIPQSLLEDYQNLVTRNNFLKAEIAKLNQRLDALQTKLNKLKAMLNQAFAMADKKPAYAKPLQSQPVVTPPAQPAQATTAPISWPQALPHNLWLQLALVCALVFLVSYLIKTYQDKRYLNRIDALTQQNMLTKFEPTVWPQATEEATTPPAKHAPMSDHTRTLLDEAKSMVKNGQPEAAAEHIKAKLREKPKTSIRLWLYLLEIFRQQQQKNEFEQYALELHQTFNVMTPAWETQEVAMVIPQSLEEFPHIIQKIVAEWPQPHLVSYLHGLIAENRDGERFGFSQSVIDEVLLLVSLLEAQRSADTAAS